MSEAEDYPAHFLQAAREKDIDAAYSLFSHEVVEPESFDLENDRIKYKVEIYFTDETEGSYYLHFGTEEG